MLLVKRLTITSATMNSHGHYTQLQTTLSARDTAGNESKLVLNLSQPPLICRVEELFKEQQELGLVLDAASYLMDHTLGLFGLDAITGKDDRTRYVARFGRALDRDETKHGYIRSPYMELAFGLIEPEYARLKKTIVKRWSVQLRLGKISNTKAA